MPLEIAVELVQIPGFNNLAFGLVFDKGDSAYTSEDHHNGKID